MAAVNIIPILTTNTTAAGTTTITHKLTVPASKRWLIDLIEVEFGTAAAGNTVDIQFDDDDAGSPANIWPQLANFNYHGVHLSSRYPRAVELEASDALEIVFTRGTSSTIESNVYIIESDI